MIERSDQTASDDDRRDDPRTDEGYEGPGPEDQTPEEGQTAQPIDQLRTGIGKVSRGGVALALLKGTLGGVFRRLRFTKGKLVAFGIGLLVLFLSVATCSFGVNPVSLTEEYGDPIPATTDAANRFVQKTGASVRRASTNRSIRLTITEAEATSALSLGLMIPELMRAVETVPQEEIRGATSLEDLREILRDSEQAERADQTWGERIASFFDPDLRTGDTQVRFTEAGEIVVAGYVQAWSFKQPALLVVRPRAGSGELELDFVKGRLGRLPAPEWAFDKLGQLISALILMGRDHVEISEITVDPGRLTFAGRLPS
jgi:hypothetical protein